MRPFIVGVLIASCVASCGRTELIGDADRIELAFTEQQTGELIIERATPAYTVGDDGLLHLVDADSPRYDHQPGTLEPRGLLIEAAATNFVRNGSLFGAASWTPAGVQIERVEGSAPNGQPAYYLRETSSGAGHDIEQVLPTDAPVGVVTFSCYLKLAERRYASLKLVRRNGVLAEGFFDLQERALVAEDDARAQWSAGPGDWQRLAVTADVGSGSGRVRVVVNLRSDDNVLTYVGDRDKGLHVWGCQLERGAAASSLIETADAAVTRAADVATLRLNGSGERGTIGITFELGAVTGDVAWIASSGATGVIAIDQSTGVMGVWRDGLLAPTANALAETRHGRAATAWRPETITTLLDAGQVATDAVGFVASDIVLGGTPAGATGETTLWIRSFLAIPEHASDDGLRALTR